MPVSVKRRLRADEADNGPEGLGWPRLPPGALLGVNGARAKAAGEATAPGVCGLGPVAAAPSTTAEPAEPAVPAAAAAVAAAVAAAEVAVPAAARASGDVEVVKRRRITDDGADEEDEEDEEEEEEEEVVVVWWSRPRPPCAKPRAASMGPLLAWSRAQTSGLATTSPADAWCSAL